MPKAYLVICYREVTNPEALAAYTKLGGPAVVANGGRILARGGRVQAFEDGIEERTIVVEFDSFRRHSIITIARPTSWLLPPLATEP